MVQSYGLFEKLCKLLPGMSFEELMASAPMLASSIPELAPMMGFDQHSPHHAYDLYTHTAYVTAAVGEDLTLRWAALLHDVGKPDTFTLDEKGEGHFYGHASCGAEIADGILQRLKAPTALRQQVVALIRLHMTDIPAEKKVVRRWLSRLGEEMFYALLALQEADMGSKGTDLPDHRFAVLRQLAQQVIEENACLHLKDLAVNGRDLLALGYAGPRLGQTLQRLLELVLEEQLPNEKQALLVYAQQLLEEETEWRNFK